MTTSILNIPEDFRDRFEVQRQDYQPIHGVVVPPTPATPQNRPPKTVFSIGCVTIFGIGMIILIYGFPKIGTILLFVGAATGVLCCCLWRLRRQLWGCLTRICSYDCCRTAEVHTPGEPSPSQPLLQHSVSEQPIVQQPASEPVIVQQPVSDVQQSVSEPVIGQQPVSDGQQPVSEPVIGQQPVLDGQQRVSEPVIEQQPISEPTIVQKPVL